MVKDDEAYIVAVNSCMLSAHQDKDIGISQLPFAVEAVFPIGPLAISPTNDGLQNGKPRNVERYSLKKPSGANVPTDNFLDPNYAGTSALIGCSQRHTLDKNLYLIAVHNPLAKNPVDTGILGADIEYVAEENGAGSFSLRSVKKP